MRSAPSRKIPQRCLWKRATDTSHWRGHESLVLSTKIAQRFVFLRLSPPGDRWCDAPGVVPAGSASVSSTLQIFRDRSHMWWLLFFRTVDCHALDSTPTKLFRGWTRSLWAFHSTFNCLFIYLFSNKLAESVRTLACMVWLLPLEVIHRFLRRAQDHLNTLYTKQKRQLPKRINSKNKQSTTTTKRRQKKKKKKKQVKFYGLLLALLNAYILSTAYVNKQRIPTGCMQSLFVVDFFKCLYLKKIQKQNKQKKKQRTATPSALLCTPCASLICHSMCINWRTLNWIVFFFISYFLGKFPNGNSCRFRRGLSMATGLHCSAQPIPFHNDRTVIIIAPYIPRGN